MTHRILHLAAYDIADQRRLHEALKVLKGYASGRQKSVFECFLSLAERRRLIAEINGVIDLDEDRFFLVRLDPRARVRTRGIAIAPTDPPWFYVG